MAQYNDAFYSPPPPGVSTSPTDVVPSPPANSGSSGKKSNVAGIVGGVIGGLLGGALVIFGIVMVWRGCDILWSIDWASIECKMCPNGAFLCVFRNNMLFVSILFCQLNTQPCSAAADALEAPPRS